MAKGQSDYSGVSQYPPKKPIDKLLQRLRFAKARQHIPKNATLLDIGTGDGGFLRYLNGHISYGVGIDPVIRTIITEKNYQLHPGYFPKDFEINDTFDVITLLAVVEHIPVDELVKVSAACWHSLTQHGRVIITAPHPIVDKILAVGKFFRLLYGLALEEHYGFNPEQLPQIFEHWQLQRKERWELGCNYLFIFGKP